MRQGCRQGVSPLVSPGIQNPQRSSQQDVRTKYDPRWLTNRHRAAGASAVPAYGWPDFISPLRKQILRQFETRTRSTGVRQKRQFDAGHIQRIKSVSTLKCIHDVLPFALAQRVRRKTKKEKGAHMRKLIILMAALAVAAAVQTSSRAIAQTAPASKDAGSTTTLTAEQKKNVAPVVRSAPARTVVHTSPVVRNVSRPTIKSVSRPTVTTRSVVKSTKPITPVVKKTVTHVPTGNKT